MTITHEENYIEFDNNFNSDVCITFDELKSHLFEDKEFLKEYLEETRREELREQFISLKKNMGLKSVDIARKLGKSPSAINRLEYNLHNSTLSNLMSYVEACGARLKLSFEIPQSTTHSNHE